MSEKKKEMAARTEPPKEKTAPQLFSLYMRTVERVRDLSKTLTAETQKALHLAGELDTRFGIRIGQRGPSTASAATHPVVAPVEGDPSNASTEEEAELAAEAAARGYTPPVQMHSDAPALVGKGSQEVEEIRRDSGVLSEVEDSEALAATGLGEMSALQARMTGKPTVVPVPGQHEPGAQAPPEERDNAGGGPVTQKPKEE